jgi:hypothetical protein
MMENGLGLLGAVPMGVGVFGTLISQDKKITRKDQDQDQD